MKNGIIINGKAYKAVSYLATGVAIQNPCSKCDMTWHCDRKGDAPCEIFVKANHLVYFKKTEL